MGMPASCAALALAAALAALQAPEPPAALTAADVVQRYIAARGGLGRIKAVRSLVLRDGRRFMAKARPYFWMVGEPGPARDYAEGNDGAPWEWMKTHGLVLRTTGAPAAAARHTAYFDDPLVSSLEPGWSVELVGTSEVGDRPAYQLRATFPDGFRTDEFVDTRTFLRVATRKVAPVHAFGAGIATETRVSDYRDVSGALFPMTFREFVIATGQPLDDVSGTWTSVEANLPLPPGYFSPPLAGETPLARMLNAAFAARAIPADALGWYRHFRGDPATAGIDAQAGIEMVGYQCLKNEAVATGVMLLEENLKEHPDSAAAHFGLGRAYRAAGREADAIARFRSALELDPGHKRAREALEATLLPRVAP